MNSLASNFISYVRELYKKPEDFIPLHAPVFNGNEKRYLNECIDTTFVSSIGEFVNQFEEQLSKYTNANAAVVCVNGTNALHIALKLIGVARGHQVITQPLSFIATANAISYCGASPIFLDVDLDTMGLSPKSLCQFLETQTYREPSSNILYNVSTKQRISACVPMHTFGHPCRIDEIVEICRQFYIPVIEDAAESLGSFFKEQHTGTFGEIGVLSFNGNKIVTTGGGGGLLLKDENLAKQAKHLITQAKIPHLWQFLHDEIGYNYRMPNINAALGLAQLEQLDNFLLSKRLLADDYFNFFSQTNIKFVKEPKNSKSNYWLNCILFSNILERDEFLSITNENGVMTRPAWTLLNTLPMFQHCQTDRLTNAHYIADRLVNIPSSVR